MNIDKGVGGLFHYNDPGGTGLVSGETFGRHAAKQKGGVLSP